MLNCFCVCVSFQKINYTHNWNEYFIHTKYIITTKNYEENFRILWRMQKYNGKGQVCIYIFVSTISDIWKMEYYLSFMETFCIISK